ncbi:MAG: hypothetical protein WC732_09695 [Candidatus Omnitrophota bacterium]
MEPKTHASDGASHKVTLTVMTTADPPAAVPYVGAIVPIVGTVPVHRLAKPPAHIDAAAAAFS